MKVIKRIDDRKKEEKKIYSWLITATDKFLSGWGEAEGGLSKCAWACKKEDVDKVKRWVKSRSDMKYVNVVHGSWYPRHAKHVHIYKVETNHPSLK